MNYLRMLKVAGILPLLAILNLDIYGDTHFTLPGAPANAADGYVRVTYGPVNASNVLIASQYGQGLAPEFSLFTVDILPSPIPPVALGRYAAWCFDSITDINPGGPGFPFAGTTFSAELYSSLDPSLNTHLPAHPQVQQPIETWNKVNWLINHRRESCSGLVPTMWEVQRAIFLIFGEVPPATADGFPNYRGAVVQCLVDSANAHSDFQPACGDKIAVIFNIVFNWDDLVPDVQLLFIEVPVSCIGDRVWEDTNANGIQDSGELGVDGVKAELFRCSDHLSMGSTLTSNGGLYEFHVPAGDYYVKFSGLPAGYVFTSVDSSADDLVDSDANVATGETICTTLSPGESDQSWDAGIYRPASLGDYVWNDFNRDGIQQSVEPGIPGVTVSLLDQGGAVIGTTVTDAAGFYGFTGLAPGTYSVRFVAPAGYFPTTRNAGADDTMDSDADIATGETQQVTLVSGEHNPTLDAGFYQNACIGDLVWEDVNGNGIQDSDEHGILGVPVELHSCIDNSLVASTVTDQDGKYGFCELMPGSYYLVFGKPSGYVYTTQNISGTPGCDDSDADLMGKTVCVTLVSGQKDLCWDTGLYKPVSVGDFVWNDTDNNGIQDSGEPGINGVKVNLSGTTGAGVAVSLTQNTAGNGGYLFANLPPGTYTVTVDAVNFSTGGALAGFSQSATLQGSNRAVDNNANPSGTTPALLPGGSSDLTLDFGYNKPCIPDWELTKVALTPNVQLGGLGAYKYIARNTSSCPISGITIVDDNGTPGDTSDDFDVVNNGAPVSGAPATFSLAANETREFVIENVPLLFELCGPTAGASDDAGMLYSEDMGDRIQVTFIQSFNRNDNTYGENSLGWKPNRPHRFKDLVNSDHVTFSVTDGAGGEKLRFSQDYITLSGGVYKSLGPNGGDGAMLVGSAANIPWYSSSLAENLNKAPFAGISDYYIDSPAVPSGGPVLVPYDSAGHQAAASDWEFFMIYRFEVLKSAFGTAGFGGVKVIDQHNSPPKSGAESFQPNVCNPCIENIATGSVSGKTGLTRTARASVCVGTGTPPPIKADLGNRVWVDTNKNGIQDADELGLAGVTVKLFTCTGTTPIATTTTGSGGEYYFTGLNAGSYKVQFVLPDGYSFTIANAGADRALDSNANTSGVTACVSLAAGEQNYTVDAGLVASTKNPPPNGPGTGTPGYWMNHPQAWPVSSITIGGRSYTRDAAITYMKAPVKSDKTYNMFAQLVSAELNLLVGNAYSCIWTTVVAADKWMSAHPVGSGVKASSNAWSGSENGSVIHDTLDDYNNGLLCAPHRG